MTAEASGKRGPDEPAVGEGAKIQKTAAAGAGGAAPAPDAAEAERRAGHCQSACRRLAVAPEKIRSNYRFCLVLFGSVWFCFGEVAGRNFLVK